MHFQCQIVFLTCRFSIELSTTNAMKGKTSLKSGKVIHDKNFIATCIKKYV